MILHTIYGEEPCPRSRSFGGAGDSRVPLARRPSARAMASLWRHQRAPARPDGAAEPGPRADATRVAAVLARATGPARRLLLEPDARELLSLYGVPVPPHRLASTADEAAAAASEMGGPLAMKLVSAGVVHKTELGAVLLDVAGAQAAAAAHTELLRRAPAVTADRPRVLITPMIRAASRPSSARSATPSSVPS